MSEKNWTWEELGQLQFSEEEVEIIMKEKISDQSRAEMRSGQLDAEAAIRKAILLMATQGSNPAQKQMLDMIDKNKTKKVKIKSKECPICRTMNNVIEGKPTKCKVCGDVY